MERFSSFWSLPPPSLTSTFVFILESMDTPAFQTLLASELLFLRDLQKGKLIQASTELDLHDGANLELLLQCRDVRSDLLSKASKVYGGAVAKTGPFNLRLSSPESSIQAVRVARAAAAFKIHPVCVYDTNDGLIGSLREPVFAFCKTYRVVPSSGPAAHSIQIKSGLNQYRIFIDRRHTATLQLKWTGVNSDFFRQGCRWALSFESGSTNLIVRQLVLAVAVCLDVLK